MPGDNNEQVQVRSLPAGKLCNFFLMRLYNEYCNDSIKSEYSIFASHMI
jgi:hypothetical protein